MSGVVLWQRIEGAVVFLAGLGLFALAGGGFGWWALLLFFAPDVSFAGYLLGPRVGAFGYNLAHVYALGAVLYLAGLWFAAPALAAIGALWLAHSGFDRMLGYGLKTTRGFGFTHLGPIGRTRGEG